nr:hypothetical protein [Paenibacillus sp. NEAU-GSW1]
MIQGVAQSVTKAVTSMATTAAEPDSELYSNALLMPAAWERSEQ